MTSSTRSYLIAICLLAATVRLTALIGLDRFEHPDLWESENIATSLLSGHGFVYDTLGAPYRSYMEPLYPALCVLVYRLTGHSFVALGLVQVGLGTVLVALVFACAKRLVQEDGALAAAGLAAVHPGLVVYTTKYHPFVLDTVLWFGAFAVVLAFAPRHPWRSACAAGLAIGLCVLTRPTILACVPLFAWWMWRRSNARGLRAAAPALVLLACAGAVAAPWTWRNYEVHHRFMLTRSGTAFVFWLGNNPYLFTGSAMTLDGGALISRAPAPVLDRLHALDELGQQDYFEREAMQFIRDQPAAFLTRWATKLGYFWWFSPQAGLLYPAAWLTGYKMFYTLTIVLAAVGVTVRWQERNAAPTEWSAALLILGCCVAISLLQSVYYVEGRHRLAIEPLLLIFAGGAIQRMMRRPLIQ